MIRIIVILLLSLVISSCNKNDPCYSFNNDGLDRNTEVINIHSQGGSTETVVEKNKYVRIRIDDGALYEEPRKYRALVRADPRFSSESIFIAEQQGSQYVPRWLRISSEDSADRVNGLVRKDRRSRGLINVYAGEGVHLKLIDSRDFFQSVSERSDDMDAKTGLTDIITTSGGVENSLIFTKDKSFVEKYDESDSYLSPDAKTDLFKAMLTGVNPFSGIGNSRKCNFDEKDYNNCRLAEGLGLGIFVGGQEYKNPWTKFIELKKISGSKYTYFLVSDVNGALDFNILNGTDGIFKDPNDDSIEVPQNIETLYSFYDNESDILEYLTTGGHGAGYEGEGFVPNKFIFGRYILEIEIGNTDPQALLSKLDNIKKEYAIFDGDEKIYEGEFSGNETSFNAPVTGHLYVKAKNVDSRIKGNMIVSIETYSSSIQLAKFLYHSLFEPMNLLIKNISSILFMNLASGGSMALFVQSALTLYLLIYGFMFSIGSVNMTVEELATVVIKVIVVSMLLTDRAFHIFHHYLFSFFLNGAEQLITSVTNVTSQEGNIFGFIDPILTKYFDRNLWRIIFTYLMHIFSGHILISIILILGIFKFLRALLGVFISYVMAFVSLSVMMALGPLFIIAMLFEKTKSYFDNWIGLMFGYVIQPTIVMIFILFLEQISTPILEGALLDICPQRLDGFSLYLPIPFQLRVPLPFMNAYIYSPYPKDLPLIIILRNAALVYCLMTLGRTILEISQALTDQLMSGATGGAGAASGGQLTSMGQDFEQSALSPMDRVGRGAIRDFKDTTRGAFRSKPTPNDNKDEQKTSSDNNNQGGVQGSAQNNVSQGSMPENNSNSDRSISGGQSSTQSTDTSASATRASTIDNKSANNETSVSTQSGATLSGNNASSNKDFGDGAKETKTSSDVARSGVGSFGSGAKSDSADSVGSKDDGGEKSDSSNNRDSRDDKEDAVAGSGTGLSDSEGSRDDSGTEGGIDGKSSSRIDSRGSEESDGGAIANDKYYKSTDSVVERDKIDTPYDQTRNKKTNSFGDGKNSTNEFDD